MSCPLSGGAFESLSTKELSVLRAIENILTARRVALLGSAEMQRLPFARIGHAIGIFPLQEESLKEEKFLKLGKLHV